MYKELYKIIDNSKIEKEYPLKKLCTFQTGGIAKYVIFPSNKKEIKDLLKYVKENNIKYDILGNGSNVLISDSYYDGIIISLKKYNEVIINNNEIISSSGTMLPVLSNIAMNNNLSGLEFVCGIPGTIGGALITNAGCYGSEIKDDVTSIEVLDKNNNILTLKNKEINFNYRNSDIQNKGYIVLSVTLELHKDNKDLIEKRIKENNIIRKNKQPINYPSAGSIFKSTSNYYAAKLIEEAGLKGFHINDAEISTKHSGFIINKGNATSKDIYLLINLIKQRIKDKYNIELEQEIKFIGNFNDII